MVSPINLALICNLLKSGFFSNLLTLNFILPLKFSFKIKSLEKISFQKEII